MQFFSRGFSKSFMLLTVVTAAGYLPAQVANDPSPVREAAEIAAEAVAEKDAECPVSLTLQSDVFSTYAWRGLILSIEPVFQPSAAVGVDLNDYGALSAGVWANMGIGDNRAAHASGVDEIDYSFGWERDFGPVTIGVGYTYYELLGTSPANAYNMHEVSAAIFYKNDFVTPFLKNFYDINESDGYYAQLGLEREFALTQSRSLCLNISAYASWADASYNKYYFDCDHGTVTDYNVLMVLSYALTERITISATLAFSGVIDGVIREYAQEEQDYSDFVWSGFSIAFQL